MNPPTDYDWLGVILINLGGGLVGAWLAHFFTATREAASRRRVFRGYIKSMIAEWKALEMDTLQKGELFSKYQSTVPGVRIKCCEISYDIPAIGFENDWVNYCGLKLADIEAYDTSKYPTDGKSILFPKYERGRQTIVALLGALLAHAK